jgi:hypothetical protein
MSSLRQFALFTKNKGFETFQTKNAPIARDVFDINYLKTIISNLQKDILYSCGQCFQGKFL